jgi:hypothetical protein
MAFGFWQRKWNTVEIAGNEADASDGRDFL